MKTASLLVLAACVAAPVVADEKKADRDKGSALYVHVVIFTLKKDAPKNAVSQAMADCEDLLAKIPSVRTLRAGRPAEKGTPDLAKKNYDMALVIFVDDFAGLEAYLKHPNHLKFVEKHGKHFDLEKLQVFDFKQPMN
jgi:hypothetical protein